MYCDNVPLLPLLESNEVKLSSLGTVPPEDTSDLDPTSDVGLLAAGSAVIS